MANFTTRSKDNHQSMVNGSNVICWTMLGQHHQFHHYNPGKSEFGENRYFKISERIYKELDQRLLQSKYLAGENYTIADIATFPWIVRHDWHDIGLKILKDSLDGMKKSQEEKLFKRL